MANNKNNSVVVSATEEANPKLKKHSILPKVLSLLFAFALWFYVVTVESPINEEVFKAIPVTIKGLEGSQLSVYSGGTAAVDVTVSGKKSVLNGISSEDLVVYADVSPYTTAGRYSVPINVELPEDVTFVENSINVLTLYLDSKATASVPVKVKLTEYVLEEGYELGGENEIEKSVSEITVTGPKTVLDTIDTALVTVPCGNVRSSINASANVELLDAKGSYIKNPYLVLDNETVDIKIPVFMTKQIKLKTEFKNNLLNSTNCKIELSPSVVKVRGATDVISTLEELVVCTIDEKSLTSEKLSVPLTMPEGVSLTQEADTVDITVSHIGTTTRELHIKELKAINPQNLDYELGKSAINITFRGKSTVISNLTAEDVTISVDLSGLKAGAGKVTLPVIVTVSEKYSSNVYEIGEYNVVVSVK